MNIDLKPYQEKAVNQLIAKAVELLDFDGPGETLVFQAPTGSGKTIMTAKFIEGLIKELPDDDICFVWMSIGKGELHLQSKHSLEKVFVPSTLSASKVCSHTSPSAWKIFGCGHFFLLGLWQFPC